MQTDADKSNTHFTGMQGINWIAAALSHRLGITAIDKVQWRYKFCICGQQIHAAMLSGYGCDVKQNRRSKDISEQA